MRRIAVAAWLCAAEALAQGRPLRPLGPVPPTVEAAPSSALGARFGVSAAQRLLASTDPDERLRGIARLGDDGSREAVEALVRAMDPGSPAVRDPRARLLAIRALARHASDEGPRGVLLRAMSEALPPDRTPTASLIGETAALGLARYGGTRGTEVLAAIVRQGGRLGDVASAALIAHPPPSLDALAGPKALASAEVARLLGELGDLRATPWLRAVVRMDEPALRSARIQDFRWRRAWRRPSWLGKSSSSWVSWAERWPKSAEMAAAMAGAFSRSSRSSAASRASRAAHPGLGSRPAASRNRACSGTRAFSAPATMSLLPIARSSLPWE